MDVLPLKHLPVPLPGNGCKNPSLDSAHYREELPRKIQARKEVEVTTASGPAIRLGTEILVSLRAELHSG